MKYLITLVLILLLAGCSQTQKNIVQPAPQQTQTMVPLDKPSAAQSPTAPAKTLDVEISDMKFTPRVITINRGDSVIWTNKDNVPHTVTFDNLAVDERLSPGQDVTHLFSDTGTFDYHCSIHPDMQGTVVVQ